MDLQKFNQKYPELMKLLDEYGYSKSYIRKIKEARNLILKHRDNPMVESYEDLYHKVVVPKYSKRTRDEYRCTIGHIYSYVEKGIFLGEAGGWSGLTKKESSYDKLCPEFKNFIDTLRFCEKETGKHKNVKTIVSACSTFLRDIQDSFHITHMKDITEESVLGVFSGKNRHENACSCIKAALRLCEAEYPSGLCQNISYMLPKFTRRHKLYDYLKPDEIAPLQRVLYNSKELSSRDKAIMKIAYYTGIRRSDIANLKFDNIDEEKEELHFVQQKTGVEHSIPFNSVVGNAILEYMLKERPVSENMTHVFLQAHRPFSKLTPDTVTAIAARFFKKADIRQEGGRRRGLHVFRHLMVTELVDADVPREIVSRLVGHTSLQSLESYLDADLKGLRECAIDISRFDRGKVTTKSYQSFAADLLGDYKRYAMDRDVWYAGSNIYMSALDCFLSENYPSSVALTQDMLEEFAKPMEGEYNKQYSNRMDEIARFVCFLVLQHKLDLRAPHTHQVALSAAKSKRFPEILNCVVSSVIEKYRIYCTTSGKWSRPKLFVLRSFEEFCCKKYPDMNELTQEMVDAWCQKRMSEGIHAWQNRVVVLNGLIKYGCRNNGWNVLPYYVPTPRNQKIIHEYHELTDDELYNFFYACDNFKYRRQNPRQARIWGTVARTIFRVLLSTGIRMKEARQLDMQDVDLRYGVINIRHTKGYIEHRVALHTYTLELMIKYNNEMEKIMPGRKCFFPNHNDKYLSNDWLHGMFHRIWYTYNDARATTYVFRHNYATFNINRFPREGFQKSLFYLSKSMGHSTIETTMYYYHFTLHTSCSIKESKQNTIQEIIPDRTNYFYDYDEE